MFPNLKAEIARAGFTYEDIAKKIGKTREWLENRLSGKCNLPIDVAFQIKEKCFPSIDFVYLFKSSAIVPFSDAD